MQVSKRLFVIVGLLAAAVVGTELIAQPTEEPTPPKKTPPPAPKPEPAPVTLFTPVTSVHDMMEGQGKLFGEIKDGILDTKWKDAEKSAWLLAEVANVNQYQNDAEDYKAWAKKMSGQCADLAKALKRRDADASRKLVSEIGATCSDCHNKYK